MSDLTPARLAELRALVAAVGPERKLTSSAPVIALLDALLTDAPALIAAAEERDRLRAEVERLRGEAEPQLEPEGEDCDEWVLINDVAWGCKLQAGHDLGPGSCEHDYVKLDPVPVPSPVAAEERWICAGCGATAEPHEDGWSHTDAAWCARCGWLR